MSILIKGAKQPENCWVCDIGCSEFVVCDFYNVENREEFKNKRMDNCPLFELPPHGRLIDADALMKVFANLVLWAIDRGKYDAFINGLSEGYQAIEFAPTCIEADSTQSNDFNALNALEEDNA